MVPLASMREQIYSYLKDEIQRGKLTPGAAINIDVMSRELGISKTPLKEAMIKLECEGFVSFLPRRGVQVRGLSQLEVKNYYEIIGYLESGAVGAVFDRLREPDTLKRLKRSNSDQEKALRREDYDQYYRMNIEFHDIFLKLSANETLYQIVIPLKQRLYDFPRKTYWKEWEEVNLAEHRQFIAAIETGDRAGAVAVIQNEHWGWQKHEQYYVKFYNFDIER